ncbi:MAG: M20/M25/M40 family metallo-hydrolase [Balneolaceae bacterium]
MKTVSKICLLLIAFTINLNSVTAQSLEETIFEMIDEVSVDNLSDHIKILEDAGGTKSRITFTPGIDSAAVYIKAAFDEIPGLTSVEIDTFYIQSAASPYNQQPQYNVIATIEGETHPDQSYVFGAHMDATANRDGNWNGGNWDTIEAPGADDNATGVAAILEMARIMTDPTHRFASEYTIKLVAFGAEEVGAGAGHYSGNHHGSIHYAQEAFAKDEEIMGMISVDMIGFNNNYEYASLVKLEGQAVNESVMLGEEFLKANDDFSIGLITNGSPFRTGNYSDHQSFSDEGYPSILIIENAPWSSHQYYQSNPYYHTSNDTYAQLNMNLVKKITQLNIATAASFGGIITSTEGQQDLADKIQLSPNYPNPFNPSTIINYSLNKATHVELSVYNVVGQEVARLVNGSQTAGVHSVTFDANNISGELTSGVYIYRLKAGESVMSRKMILLK